MIHRCGTVGRQSKVKAVLNMVRKLVRRLLSLQSTYEESRGRENSFLEFNTRFDTGYVLRRWLGVIRNKSHRGFVGLIRRKQ